MKKNNILFSVLLLLLVSMACQVLSSETPTPYPTYTPLPTYTPQPEAVEEGAAFPFALTLKTYSETDESLGEACQAALGPGWRMADWNDIVSFVEAGNSVEEFVTQLDDFTNLWVTYNGEGWYSEQRHYFIEVHNHELPEGWLSHADLDDHYLDVGSWYDMDLAVLCYQSDSPAAVAEGEEAPQTPETPPTFDLAFSGFQSCGEWPNYAVFEAESTSIWILQSAHFEVTDTTNGKAVYSGNNDRPFLESGGCPPGDTILPPFNTRYLAVNVQEPEPGTQFSAEITLCTEEGVEGECVEQTIDFVFGDEQVGESELPFIGVWENAGTGMTAEFTETSLVRKFSFEGGQREIYYTISDYDLEEGHIDLVTDKVLQEGEEVDYDWEPERYLSYTIDEDVITFFIAPAPYPRAEAGVSYTREDGGTQEQGDQPEGEPSFDLAFAGTHPCGEWPHYAAFQVENTSDYTFESVRLMVDDVTNEQTVYVGNNNRGFAEARGCPPGESTLPPGGTAEVAANIKEPEPGTEFEAVIKLCTEDGLEGECVSERVSFTFGE